MKYNEKKYKFIIVYSPHEKLCQMKFKKPHSVSFVVEVPVVMFNKKIKKVENNLKLGKNSH